MLFAVLGDFSFPHDLDAESFADHKAREIEYVHDLQRNGILRHMWRGAGTSSNLSIFDVTSNDQLHEVLSGLPFFRYVTTRVIPLATHPSALPDDASPTA